MFPKEEVLDLIRLETKVCKHLFTKLDEADLGFRAVAGMRSLEELLRYLTYCVIGPAHAIVHDDWESYQNRAAAATSFELATFPQVMDRQLAEVEALFARLDDEVLRVQRTMPWGETLAVGVALMRTTSRFMAAYRMQLFLHAKQAGHPELASADCWLGGIDQVGG